MCDVIKNLLNLNNCSESSQWTGQQVSHLLKWWKCKKILNRTTHRTVYILIEAKWWTTWQMNTRKFSTNITFFFSTFNSKFNRFFFPLPKNCCIRTLFTSANKVNDLSTKDIFSHATVRFQHSQSNATKTKEFSQVSCDF